MCGRTGQRSVSLGVTRPRADSGRKLNQIKGNERRRGANGESRREWICSRCGDWGPGLRGGVRLPHWNYSLAYEGQTGQEVAALYWPDALAWTAVREWQRTWKLCSAFLFCARAKAIAHAEALHRAWLGWLATLPSTAHPHLGLINQPCHWQPNRARPIHEYFPVWSRALRGACQDGH